MLSPYHLPYFFDRFGAEQIMIEHGFKCGLYWTTDSDLKWSGFRPKNKQRLSDKYMQQGLFHHCKQYKQKLFILAIRSNLPI
jgi:hypothetical protein